jgi:hypothetical protein
MEKMTKVDFKQLSEAAALWSGSGMFSMPSRDWTRVIKRFGEMNAKPLIEKLKSLEDDFYATDAHRYAKDVNEMGEMAANDFRSQHPGIPDDIVNVFTWCYTYDFR